MVLLQQLTHRCKQVHRFSDLLQLRNLFNALDAVSAQIMCQLTLYGLTMHIQQSHLFGLRNQFDVLGSLVFVLGAQLFCTCNPLFLMAIDL